ncbi:MAG TPA: hypothetical protein DHV41_04780 [Parachlamydiales bacterium]|nr:hypothetical protein [Parachlamydiales bacterium]
MAEHELPLSTALKHQISSSAELQREEREQFIDSLLSRAEIRLIQGDLSALDLFEAVAKLDPSNADLFFRQGLSLFECGCEQERKKTLFLACKKFKKAASLSPGNYRIWHAWGNTLFALGLAFHQECHFLQAKEKLERALRSASEMSKKEISLLYGDLGRIFVKLGEHSGEAIDFQMALSAFQKGYDLDDEQSPDFWLERSRAYLALAQLIPDTSLFLKAGYSLRHALRLEPANSEIWITLAACLKELYFQTHDEGHFSQANDSFSAASQLEPNLGSLCFSWAQFLLHAGLLQGDLKRLHASIEKCCRALSLGVEKPLVQGVWSEALAAIGLETDHLELMLEAENRALQAVEECPDSPELYLAHGNALYSLGAYFNDIDYTYQAIEKYQEGLSIDRSRPSLWHAMAKSYSTLALLDAEDEAFSKAYRFFSKALQLRWTAPCLFDFALCLSRQGEFLQNSKWLHEALFYFEQALSLQKNAVYLHPDWLFHYAVTLDLLGDLEEDEKSYLRAIEIFSHVLMIDPDFPQIHYRLALALCHFGDVSGSTDSLYKALHHFRLSAAREEENDQILLDWGLTLANLAEKIYDPEATDLAFQEGEQKVIQAAKLGNVHAYYHLGSLYALRKDTDKALHFLEKARQFDALPPLEEILEDEWLDNLRHTSSFHTFLSQLEGKPHTTT